MRKNIGVWPALETLFPVMMSLNVVHVFLNIGYIQAIVTCLVRDRKKSGIPLC